MDEKRGFISIRKKMMVVFVVLITVTGIGIASLFAIVFRYGYSSLSQIYLNDINEQTTNNLENNIQKIEDINVCLLYTSVQVSSQKKGFVIFVQLSRFRWLPLGELKKAI